MPTNNYSCTEPKLMHPDVAMVKLLEQIKPIDERQLIPLEQALGRVLAEDISANIDLPPFNNSSMDGYAFSFNDLARGDPLTLIGESFAGHPFEGAITANSCVRIMTGAVVPEGYDTVQMQENTRADGDKIMVEAPKSLGANIRYRAGELKAGAIVMDAGTQIGASQLGVLATVGANTVSVYRKIKVAFFSTGDELRPVGSALKCGQIYDSNRYTLQGLLDRANIDAVDLGVIEDDPESIHAAFLTASSADMILTSGGVSVGDADHTKQVIETQGELTLWKLAIKPGKPFAFGRLGNAVFCGLPGNPVSTMVTFYKLVWPLIRKMQGLAQITPPQLQARLKTRLNKTPGRVEYQRGILSYNVQGEPEVMLTGGQQSSMLTSMSLANCFVILAQQQGDLLEGDTVTVEPFNFLMS